LKLVDRYPHGGLGGTLNYEERISMSIKKSMEESSIITRNISWCDEIGKITLSGGKKPGYRSHLQRAGIDPHQKLRSPGRDLHD
jgi:hypothetical protein